MCMLAFSSQINILKAQTGFFFSGYHIMSFFAALAFKNSLTGSPSQGSTAPEPEPIGVFWDIENCPVPRGKSASAVVQKIRKEFFSGKREVEFMCVCDINKEKKEVIEELNKAQVRFQIPWTCFVYVNLTRAMDKGWDLHVSNNNNLLVELRQLG